MKEELKKITKKEVQINIFEVKRPELDAAIVAGNIARQVEGKISYRRAIKMAIASTMRMGAEGIKVVISGRLGGAEMARRVLIIGGGTGGTILANVLDRRRFEVTVDGHPEYGALRDTLHVGPSAHGTFAVAAPTVRPGDQHDLDADQDCRAPGCVREVSEDLE